MQPELYRLARLKSTELLPITRWYTIDTRVITKKMLQEVKIASIFEEAISPSLARLSGFFEMFKALVINGWVHTGLEAKEFAYVSESSIHRR